MKKFTLYSWQSDDEGGEGVCLSEKFTTNVGYQPWTGWRAMPSYKIGEFGTVEELENLLKDFHEDYYNEYPEELQHDVKNYWRMAQEIEHHEEDIW